MKTKQEKQQEEQKKLGMLKRLKNCERKWNKYAKRVCVAQTRNSLAIPKEILGQIEGYQDIWYYASTDGKNILFESGCKPLFSGVTKEMKFLLNRTYTEK